MMNRFWKWLAARKFMKEYVMLPTLTAEQELAQAVLRFCDERGEILAAGGIYSSRVKGHNHLTGANIAAHYEVWPCYEPDVCFGAEALTGGATVQ